MPQCSRGTRGREPLSPGQVSPGTGVDARDAWERGAGHVLMWWESLCWVWLMGKGFGIISLD